MRPTWRPVGAFALAVILGFYGVTSEVAWLFLLSNWMVAALFACALYSLWNQAGLSLHLAVGRVWPAADSPTEELPEAVLRSSPTGIAIFERDSLELEVGLRSKRGARGPAWVGGQVGGKNIAFATGLVPAAGWMRRAELDHLCRGPIGATGWAVSAGDPLGFFRGRRRAHSMELALVLPRFASLADRRRTRELEAAAAAPRAGSGSEVFGIREHRPGDSLRRIHWRASARHGELVVREYEPPGLRTMALWLDPAPASPEIADQVARLAASEAWDCIRDGGRVSLWAPGLQATPPLRDLWSVLEWLARYPNLPAQGFAATSPVRGEETVIVTASANPELLDAAELARGARGWLVGDEAVETGIQVERVGTGWPL